MPLHSLAPVIAVCLVALTTPTLVAQFSRTPNSVERVTTIEGVTEYRLPNGLRAVFAPDPSLSNITVNVTYLAGSRHENYGEAGLAHLVEHLVGIGSASHPDTKQEQQARGATSNGSTDVDHTSYWETFPASPANLEWALDLEADRMVNARLELSALHAQRTVVRNEIENRERDSLRVLSEYVFAALYDRHPYGRNPIGASEDLEQITLDRVGAFYRRYYQPDNAVVFVVGNFDESAAVRLIDQKFGVLARPSRTLDAGRVVEPPQDGERLTTVQRNAGVQAVSASYRTPGVAHPDATAVDLLRAALGRSPGGPLHRAVVGTGTGVQVSSVFRAMRDESVLTFEAMVQKDGSVEVARRALVMALDEAASSPLTQADLERARIELLTQVERAFADPQQLARALGNYAGVGDWRLFFIRRDRLRAITADDVRRVANTYLKPVNRTLGLFTPVSQPRVDIPAPLDAQTVVDSYRGAEAGAAGEPFETSPENIERRTIRALLTPGIKLAMLPKRTRGAAVVFSFQMNYGDENALLGRAAVAELVPAMLAQGTVGRDRQQFEDAVAGLRLTIDVGGTGGVTRVTGQTVRQYLPDALRLLAEMLRQPALTESEFERIRQERIAFTEQMRTSPFAVAVLGLARLLDRHPLGHPRYVPSVDERLAALRALRYEQLREFHQDFFGASNVELAIVGDFEPDEVRQVLAESFRDWRSRRSYAAIPRPFQSVRGSSQTVHVEGQAMAEIEGGTRLQIGEDHADYPAMVMASALLNTRLVDRLRSKEGWSYSAGARFRQFPEPHLFWRNQLAAFSSAPRDRTSDLIVFATSAPENAARVELAMKEELARALQHGFTPEEVARTKQAVLQSQAVARSRDSQLAGRLLEHLQADRTMSFDVQFSRRVGALTPQDVHAVLQRHLRLDDISFLRVGSFSSSNGATSDRQ